MAFFNPKKMKTDGKYYPVAVIVDEPIETEELAEQISLASTVSKADVVAVFAALPSVMAQGMNSGRSVHLQDIGHFRYTINARKGGKDTADEVTADDVEATRIRFTPETRFANKGAAATRALVSGNVRWVRWGGAPTSSSGSTDTGGSGGGQGENPLG